MARRVFIAIALVALAVCATALAQTGKVTDNTKIGAVEVKRARLVEDPTLLPVLMPLTPQAGRGVAKSEEGRVIPWHINYQGYLTDNTGNPINDTLSMTFRIYTASGGGSELWNEPQVVTVEDGLFNVVLGVSTPIPASVFELGESRWLELEVEAQILSPRTEVTSVGYAYRAVKTDSADYASGSDMVDGFDASATPGPNDLFTLSYGDAQYVNEGQADAIDSPMILDGTVQRADAEAAFKAPYADTADYALGAPATPDNDWTIAGSVLHPSGDYGLAMRSTNVLHGDSTHSHVNFGIACTTGTSGPDYPYCTVSGGLNNTAGEPYATVGGGQSNRATDDWAAVAGGYSNAASNPYTIVAGGAFNTASGNYATICGGLYNTASGEYATVSGGCDNTAIGDAATVGGGRRNRAHGLFSVVSGGGGPSLPDTNSAIGDWSTVGGGRRNAASDSAATVGGGDGNNASGQYATVGGGQFNTANLHYGTVGGGTWNTAGNRATVGGGESNYAIEYGATVGGGYGNLARNRSTVAGGQYNVADGHYATVGGGVADTAKAFHGGVLSGYGNLAGDDGTDTAAVVVGGRGNSATAFSSFIGGGEGNNASNWYTTVGGGFSNTTSGLYATVAGGYSNTASASGAAVAGGRDNSVAGDHSFAVGRQVTVDAAADYTFAFGRNFTTTTPNAVVFYNSVNAIRVGIGMVNPGWPIHVYSAAYCDGNNWVNVSSREYKKDIRALSPKEYQGILAKLSETEVVRFRYKTQENDELHIGVIAEDVPEELVDAEKKGIPTGDAIGFLLAAMKAQQEEIETLREEVEALKRR